MAAIFAHSSSGPVPLRTLTLGVLIVSGGTLAALPFRRYHAIPDRSTTPVQATGPTNSALQIGATGPVCDAIFAPPQTSEAILPGSIIAKRSEDPGVRETQQQPPSSPGRTTSFTKTEPSHGGPLTYEDLVLPIEMPDIIQQRFNATAAVKSIQMEKERFAKTTDSQMEAMTPTSSGTRNSADTSLFASQSRSEMASDSVLKPSGNQSATDQINENQQPRMLTSGSNPDDPTSRVTRAPVTRAPVTRAPVTRAPVTRAPVNGAPVNGAMRQMPFHAEPTPATKVTAGKETTAGSLASTSTARNTARRQPLPANPADPEILSATESNHSLPKADSPSRARHWIQQPN